MSHVSQDKTIFCVKNKQVHIRVQQSKHSCRQWKTSLQKSSPCPKTLKTWEEEKQLSFKWVGLFVVCGRRFIKARILQRVVSHGNASAWKQDDLLTTGSVRAQEAGNGHKQITWILDVSCHIAPKIQSGQRSLVNSVKFILLKIKLVLLNPADTSGWSQLTVCHLIIDYFSNDFWLNRHLIREKKCTHHVSWSQEVSEPKWGKGGEIS